MEILSSGMEVNNTRTLSGNGNLRGAGNASYTDNLGLNMTINNFRFFARNLSTSNPNVNMSWMDLLLLLNDTYYIFEYIDMEEGQDYIFDDLHVRVIFILLYSIVFCFCFFGNLMVILVVTLHWRMRNITRFCLGNLAFADLCVGVFCIYQNLSTYLIKSWVLGEFLCKMYQFINALSHTAAVLILVVICVERYLAILHPFRAKQIMTMNRLRVVIILVWVVSAIYCSPRLYYIVTIEAMRLDGSTETICAAQRSHFNSKAQDIVHFFLLFLVPLLVISILYTRVGITLWRSSNYQLQVSLPQLQSQSGASSNNLTATTTTAGRDAWQGRKTVVKMMIVVLFTFALFNFPFHLRKMFQYWWPNYDYVSLSSTLATPLTYLLMYANCAINPVIYAFMSKEFRSSFKDLFCCRWKKSFERGN